jgi:cytochrome c oxidase cbb3-type subunit I/II
MDTKHNESEKGYGHLHRKLLEGKAALFAISTTVVISIGALVELIPMFSATSSLSWERGDWVTPYTPLEVAGRDLYVREGCYVCHSQMIRPMRAEMLRYGEWSRAAEFQYDRPFLLGSRRTGPDLQREGGKRPDAWHYQHMKDPRSMTAGSIMPEYPWLLTGKIDADDVAKSLVALTKVGTPYVATDVSSVAAALQQQGDQIVASLAGAGVTAAWDDEIVALIAYLQRLGKEGSAHLAVQQGGGS